jgi:hypothetical protein
MPALFAEELGMLIEVAEEGSALESLEEAAGALGAGSGCGNAARLCALLARAGGSAVLAGVPCVQRRVSARVGAAGSAASVPVPLGATDCMLALRALWESTSFALEARQCAAECVASEAALSRTRCAPAYVVSAGCAPEATAPALLARAPSAKPRVAVIRCEGCNGDREMGAALYAAGCEVWDVHISDLAEGRGPGLELLALRPSATLRTRRHRSRSESERHARSSVISMGRSPKMSEAPTRSAARRAARKSAPGATRVSAPRRSDARARKTLNINGAHPPRATLLCMLCSRPPSPESENGLRARMSSAAASSEYRSAERDRQSSTTTASGLNSSIAASTSITERSERCDVPSTKISSGSTWPILAALV